MTISIHLPSSVAEQIRVAVPEGRDADLIQSLKEGLDGEILILSEQDIKEMISLILPRRRRLTRHA